MQVSPVTLNLQPRQMADGIWLSNVADQSLYAQVRVYHWVQQNGQQQLIPSQGLIISPPLLQIAPGDRQLVRVIRLSGPPAGPGAVEDAYRLAIDELPVASDGKNHGLRFVLHYSIPIFLEPAGIAAPAPRLHWDLVRHNNQVLLQVSNDGTGHAQLSAVHFVSGGHAGTVTDGLLGYVLPGAMMQFALRQAPSSFVGRVTFTAVVNGSSMAQDVSLADSAR
ncbi:molecular chaperone [Acidisoma silvae]|uniref:Molecular chaperone n=1 Tax=Acidisoma silvae TaxID=2802396 RepID=A0A964E014_9PROT|nr:molecular chaperone [Acidisoma silvae]